MPGNPHPWRIMSVLFVGVLLCSFGLQKFIAPAGNMVIRAVDTKSVTVTGTIQADLPHRRLVLENGAGIYLLADPPKALPYTGRKVRIAGTFHESTGVLDIQSITSLLDHPANAQ
jgi:hypothetical protein